MYSVRKPEISGSYFHKTVEIRGLLTDSSYIFTMDFPVKSDKTTKQQMCTLQHMLELFNENRKDLFQKKAKLSMQINGCTSPKIIYYKKPQTHEVIHYHYVEVVGVLFADKNVENILKLLEVGLGARKYDGMGMVYLNKLNMNLEAEKSNMDLISKAESLLMEA
jgi:hypothetical protein